EGDYVRSGREGVGRDDDLVTRVEPEREHGEMERRRPGGDRDRVGRLADRRELVLELGDHGPLGAHPGPENLGDQNRLLGARVRPGETDPRYLVRYHSIVLASPSSSSTSGSQPSSSRAFSTLGMRSSTST